MNRAPASPPPAELLEAARACEQQMVAFLVDLAAIETPSLEPAAQEPAFELLAAALEEAGMRSRRWRGRETGGVLLGRAPARGGVLQLLVGHCDTVWPRGTLEAMPVVQEGDLLRGPGVFDMKCGLTQMIWALRLLHELGARPALAPVVLINSDEEIGSHESERWIRRLARLADRTFVLEPALTPAGKLKTARKGVGQYRLLVRGRAAHAGLDPERGVSAILEMSRLVERLFALNDPVRGVSVNVGTISGGTRPNVIAAESRAVVDVRVPTAADAARIDRAIRSLEPSRPEISIEIEGGESRPPLEPTPGGRALWASARGIARQLGIDLEEGTAGGGSDGNLTNQYSPTLDGLGAVGDGAHATHEHVDVSRMAERTALLGGLLLLPPVEELPVAAP